MSSPRITKGGSVTDNYPYERFPGNKGDKVHVVCQVKGETIRNESNQASNIWDKVIIPKAKVLQNASGLTATQDSRGYFAYASDLWLGNTGWHKIAC